MVFLPSGAGMSCSVACLVVVYRRLGSTVTLVGARLGRTPLNHGEPCSDRLLGNLDPSDPSRVHSDTFLGWAQSRI